MVTVGLVWSLCLVLVLPFPFVHKCLDTDMRFDVLAVYNEDGAGGHTNAD